MIDLERIWRDTHKIQDSSQTRIASAIFRDDEAAMEAYGLRSMESITKYECLFLLGRPGAGKSAEIERLASGAVSGFADEWLVVMPCKEMGEDLYLEVRRDARWKEARSHNKPVRLVLDGLDEGFLRQTDYFPRLKRALINLRSENPKLRLLLTCRPAEWDSAFGAEIYTAWRGEGEPPVFGLEPLSPRSQRALIESQGISNPDRFFGWVRLNNFEEFAAWPRSLEWLAAEFMEGRGSNVTYTELCRRRVARSFQEDKRLEEAGLADRAMVWTHAVMLVAATLVFCGRKGIALNATEPDCIGLDEMFPATGSLEVPSEPPLTRERVREAVKRSNLMEAHNGFHRFQNQSDLEYLAAAMLASLDVEQLSELFGSPDDDAQWRVFPQLATTAANLAAQADTFFEFLLKHDPRVLLRADFGALSEDKRRVAVERILTATSAAKAPGEHEQHAHFATLHHQTIEEQLSAWLFDKAQLFVTRDLAFDIAMACCGPAFWEKFWRVASADTDEFIASRLPSVLMRFGADWPEERLKELSARPNSRLSGAAMNALLDRTGKVRDLVPFLHEANDNEYNAYDVLLERIPRECKVDDLVPILDRIGTWPSLAATAGSIRRLAEALVSKALTWMHRADVREALTKFLIARFHCDHWLFEGSDLKHLAKFGLETAERRRELLLELAKAWSPVSTRRILGFEFPILREDLGWLFDEVAIASGPSANVLASLASNFAWQIDDEHRQSLERAYSASAELRARLPPADTSGIFDTLGRLRAEAKEEQRKRLEEFASKRKRDPYNNENYFANALAACRAGRLEAWTNLCLALSRPESQHDHSAFFQGADVRQLVGWLAASDDLRAELTQIAREFLLRAEIEVPKPGQIPGGYFGLVYALSLHAHRLTQDSELHSAARPVWALALLCHCSSEGSVIAELLKALTASAPTVVADACEHRFRERWERNESIFGELLHFAWSSATESSLVRVLEAVPLQPESYMSGLALLTRENPSLARRIATSRLAEHAKQPNSGARRATVAACLFIANDLWTAAWPHFTSDPGSARQLLLEYSGWLRYPEQEQRLNEAPISFIAALCGQVMQCFPLKDQPRHEGGHVVTALDNAYDLHQKLLNLLESVGAHRELKIIYGRNDELRNAWWAGLSLERARTKAHAQRRTAPDVVEFVRFLSTEGGTFIRDNDSLQRAVLGSLRRFEKNLHPNHILRLWHEKQPRSEEVFQIEVADHLEHDLKNIVVNMETKVERHERADIRVQAPPYSVTLEVKLGHSNDKHRPLTKAMRTQLRETYLANRNEMHGVYVVGWFFCTAFRSGGLRNIKSLAAAKKYFTSQARRLSVNGYKLEAAVLDCRLRDSAAARMERRNLRKVTL